jgi:flagellar basal body-associated protein FliL
MKYTYIIIAVIVVAVIVAMWWHFSKMKVAPQSNVKKNVTSAPTNTANNTQQYTPGTPEYNNAFANANLLGQNNAAPQATYVSNGNNNITITPASTPLTIQSYSLGNLSFP